MSYRRTWSKTFSSDEFKDPEVAPPSLPPIRCPDHPDTCFKAVNLATDAFTTAGTWKLRTPIDVASMMPGEKQKILTLETKGLYNISPWTWIIAQGSHIFLLGDGAEIFRYNNLTHYNNKWATNPLTLNKMVDIISSLDIALEQIVDVKTGAFALHDANITISCEYYSIVPPSTGDLELTVVDAETGIPVPNIRMRLMSGTFVVREGYSDGEGVVLWSNIDEGSYVLHTYGIPPSYWKGGYAGIDYAVTVTPDVLNAYTLSLPPLPPTPIPWWVLPAGIVVAAVVGYTILKPRIPIYVVR